MRPSARHDLYYDRNGRPTWRRCEPRLLWPWVAMSPLALPIVSIFLNSHVVFVLCLTIATAAVAGIVVGCVATVRWATKGMVPAETVTPDAYAEARLEGLFKAADHVKPSWEDPEHPLYEGPPENAEWAATPEKQRGALLERMIEHRYRKAANAGRPIILEDGARYRKVHVEPGQEVEVSDGVESTTYSSWPWDYLGPGRSSWS